MAKILKASNKGGQAIIERCGYCEGTTLREVYGTYSQAKENAYEWCYNEYLNTENHRDFAINSHNTFGFTCSWLGTINGHDALRYETKDNTYIVYLDR